MSEKNNANRKNRRPTREEQIKIQRTISPYYNRGLSIEEVHRITGHNSKTVSKCFNKLSDEIDKSETQNVVDREKDARRRAILRYQDLICESYEILDDIKEDAEKCKKENKIVPPYFLSKELDAIRLIATLNEKITSLRTQPTLEETLEKLLEEKMNKLFEEKMKKLLEEKMKLFEEKMKKNDQSDSEK